MRIAILTFHRAYNCGAMLQAWALQVVLRRMGHESSFPICNHVGEAECRLRYERKSSFFHTLQSFIYRTLYNIFALRGGMLAESRYRRFREKLLSERAVSEPDLEAAYDCAVIGSDQVWSSKIAGDHYSHFIGETLPARLPRVSYAASYGDRSLTAEEQGRLVSRLKRFTAVSVRERRAQQELTGLGVQEVACVLDPTLLLMAEDYRVATDGIRWHGPYLYVYWVSGGARLLETARALAKRLNVKLVVTPVYIHSAWGAPKGMTLGVSPGRLLAYTQKASYVLAASFHGTVFGVLFKRPLLSYSEDGNNRESRQASLLNSLGISDRLVSPETPIDEMVRLLYEPIPEEVYSERLPKLRQESLDWLKAALEKVERERRAKSL